MDEYMALDTGGYLCENRRRVRVAECLPEMWRRCSIEQVC